MSSQDRNESAAIPPQATPARQTSGPLTAANVGVKMRSPSTAVSSGLQPQEQRKVTQAQFGQPSPLRNSLFDDTSDLYNPLRGPSKKKPISRLLGKDANKRTDRPIESAGNPVSVFNASSLATTTSANHVDQDDWQDPVFQSALRDLQTGMQRQPRTIIDIPRNRPTSTTAPPPRPIFSSHDPKATKITSAYSSTSANQNNQPSTAKQYDDDEGEDDGFDPDAAIVAARVGFGAPDPTMYLDADRANENIKHLIEGAFDESSDKPHIPLNMRQTRSKRSNEDKQSQKLADKLSALTIKQPANNAGHDKQGDVDDGTIDGLAVRLLPHQVEGVSWMLDKESGKRKNGVVPRGGILADDMGLGKTVQSVALLLLNPRPETDLVEEMSKSKVPSEASSSGHLGGVVAKEKPASKGPRKEVGKSTLIVAPLALIRQWESEIQSKVKKSHALRVLVHHGSSRTKSSEMLKKYDVVITTYQILTSEHAASDLSRPEGSRIGCFGVHWYRIILDEAHSIKNRNAKSTLACCALNSWYRWCLTGTPMQNNLDELQSLIGFLRIKPYHELAAWKRHITQPMKSGQGGVAMARLHHFLKAVMKRRTKDILKKEGALNFGGVNSAADGPHGEAGGLRIVKREIVNVECAFNDAEQEYYDRLSDRAQKRLDDMFHDGGKTDYIGALVLLLRLRQACDHTALIDMAANKSGLDIKDIELATPRNSRVAEAEVDALADMFGGVTVSNRLCDICGITLRETSSDQDQAVCSDCEKDMSVLSDKVERKHSKTGKQSNRRQKRVLVDSDDEEDEDESDDSAADQEILPSTPKPNRSSIVRNTYNQPSTKIEHILQILEHDSVQHKTIIFSQFTSMLDLIQPHIEQRFVRYDGSMRPDEREAALASLRTNPKTRVLLCSLKCGSLGLNLTAASRVIIVEPFWNPFVEEQAIDRVHRLNQTVDVKVYRLTIANTVEERILALQQKKRELASAALEGGKAIGKLSMEDILGLFSYGSHSVDMTQANAEFDAKFGKESRLIDGPIASPQKKDREYHDGSGADTASRRVGTNGYKEHQVYGRRW